MAFMGARVRPSAAGGQRGFGNPAGTMLANSNFCAFTLPVLPIIPL
jgi:hypothetical protein